MAAFALLTTAVLASALPAQIDSTARMRGRASSSFNGLPIAGVMISVPAARRFAVTDSSGFFWLDGLPAGRQRIRVSYEGRETEDVAFSLHGHRTLRIAVLLDVDALDLHPVIVEARSANIWRDLAGFYERRDLYTGFARFFTREEIKRVRAGRISGVLTLEGIATRCSQWCVPTRLSNGVLCAVPINVDGMPFQEVNYDEIAISDVAAVEIYRGVPPVGLDVPLPGPPGSSVWVGGGPPSVGSCGLVLIWTR